MLSLTRRLLALFIVSLSSMSTAVADIELAIVTPRGAVETMERWSETAKHLSAELGETVNIQPLSTEKILESARNGELDFVLSHSAHTSALLSELDGRVVATVKTKNGPRFGGVIVAKKGSGIAQLSDLRGKRIMSMKVNEAAGGYIFQAYELKKAGIDPRRDIQVTEGKKQDDLIMAVMEGKADAAFVRTGMIEEMAKEGAIKLEDVVVVNQQHVDGFVQALSTELYSEWCMTAMPHVASDTSQKMKSALLQLSPQSAAAQQARIDGFVDAVSLENIKSAMKSLQIAPYNK